MVDKYKAHLIKTKNIIDSWDETFFKDVTEQNLNEDAHTVTNVCIFGTRFSKNGYEYQDQAVNSLTRLAEGARFFVDHPSKDEDKAREGVRSMHSWGGIFINSRRSGDKVFADLKVRESFWPLVKDVAMMRPVGIGNSINSMVKVYKDDKGQEQIVDIATLKSVDLVSSAATTTSLFESASELVNNKKIAKEKFIAAINGKKFNEDGVSFDEFDDYDFKETCNLLRDLWLERIEGLLTDKMRDREIAKKVSKLNWDVSDLIDEIVRDSKMPVTDKKKQITSIMDDYENEVKKILNDNGKTKTNENLNEGEEDEMDFSKLTLEEIKKERPDLIEQVESGIKTGDKVVTLETENTQLKEKAQTLETENTQLKKEKEDLTKEKDDYKKKVDEHEVIEARSKKDKMVTDKLKESKLPDEAISWTFLETLVSMDEAAIDKAIDDRRQLWEGKGGVIKNNGTEFDPNKQGEITDEKKEAAKNKFKKVLGK